MFTTQDGKLNSGWYRSANAKLAATIEIVNYQNVSKNIFMEMDVEYKKVGRSDINIKEHDSGGNTDVYLRANLPVLWTPIFNA